MLMELHPLLVVECYDIYCSFHKPSNQKIYSILYEKHVAADDIKMRKFSSFYFFFFIIISFLFSPIHNDVDSLRVCDNEAPLINENKEEMSNFACARLNFPFLCVVKQYEKFGEGKWINLPICNNLLSNFLPLIMLIEE